MVGETTILLQWYSCWTFPCNRVLFMLLRKWSEYFCHHWEKVIFSRYIPTKWNQIRKRFCYKGKGPCTLLETSPKWPRLSKRIIIIFRHIVWFNWGLLWSIHYMKCNFHQEYNCWRDLTEESQRGKWYTSHERKGKRWGRQQSKSYFSIFPG